MTTINDLAMELAEAHVRDAASMGATWSRFRANLFETADLERMLREHGLLNDEQDIEALRCAIGEAFEEIDHLPTDGGELLDALFGDSLSEAIEDVRAGSLGASQLVQDAARDAQREGGMIIAGSIARAVARLEKLAGK